MDLCYYMNGGITRTEAMMLSPKERIEHIEHVGRILKEKAEALTGQEFM